MEKAKIPRSIHCIFFDTKANWPKVFQECSIRLKMLHPDWSIKLYNAQGAREIISSYLPDVLPIYDSYPHYIQRADLFRVILVYLFGGFYLDMDMFCTKPLDELLNCSLVLPEERSVSGIEKQRLARLDGIEVKHSFRIGNYMFGGVPRHPFWLFCLKAAVKVAGTEIRHEGDILETTGPALLTNVYHRCRKRFPDILVLRNRDRSCLMPFHNEISCHFGNFAIHLHQGTWRWMHNNSQQVPTNKIDIKLINSASNAISNRIRGVANRRFYLADLPKSEKKDVVNKSLFDQFHYCTIPFVTSDDAKPQGTIIIIGLEKLQQCILNHDASYILIITSAAGKVLKSALNKIRKFNVKCIVFSRSVLDFLKKNNLLNNIYIKKTFFLPIKRDFSDGDAIMGNFNIGLFSDLSVRHIVWINALVKHLNSKIENCYVFILHANNEFNNGIYKSKKIKFININEDILEKSINNLSIFVSCNENLKDAILLNTAFYLGIPCIAESTNSIISKKILKYAFSYENSNSQEAIVNAIVKVRHSYLRYNRKALKASRYLEDQHSIERIANAIIKGI